MPFVVYIKVRKRQECHLKSMVTGLSKPLDYNEPFEFESDNKTAEVEIDLQLSIQEKARQSYPQENEFQFVKKELAIFEVEGKREANLERIIFDKLINPGVLKVAYDYDNKTFGLEPFKI
jgi:hypothetical protein